MGLNLDTYVKKKKGNPLQYSCWENPTDRGAWRATVHRVSKSQTQLIMHIHTREKNRCSASEKLNGDTGKMTWEAIQGVSAG